MTVMALNLWIEKTGTWGSNILPLLFDLDFEVNGIMDFESIQRETLGVLLEDFAMNYKPWGQ